MDEIASILLTEVANDFPENMGLLTSFIQRAAEDPRAITNVLKYTHEPVGPREFVESPTYMNKPGALWPRVMDEFCELNSGKYVESVLTGGIGSGKALDVDTPIPTPSGWTRMGDLQDGDTVFDEHGEMCSVLSAHPVMLNRTCYEIRFSDGSSIVADEDHLWRVWSASQRHTKTHPEVLSTKQIASTIYRDYGIEVAGSLKLADVPGLGIDPYVLGVWLGDGSSDGNRIGSVDEDVILELRRHYWITEQPRPNAVPARTIHGIGPALRAYNLYGNKHIPPVFLRASEDQRLALLQGLMDSDGTIDKRQGNCEFTQKKKRLAYDVLELVRSLGLKPTIRERTAMLRGKDCGLVYTVAFTPRDKKVFRLPRKAKYLKPCVSKVSPAGWRYIKEVVPVPSRPVRCITVDSDSKLYLAGEAMVPTHNTTLALYTQAYQLYLLSCLRNPHAEFDLDPASEILIVFQSISEKLAKGVDYMRFREMIEKAPYFRSHFPFETSLASEMRFPKRIIVKPVAGTDTAAIGQNVIGGLIDEINFMAVVEKSKMSKDGETYDQAVQNYNSIARRRESRFMQLGALPGMLCLVSSRNYRGEFTDVKEAEARTNPRIFVYDKRIWEIRPEKFGDARFKVFVGDETRKPYILKDGAEVPIKDEALVVEVPVEYRHSFESDMLAALRDIAGVATNAIHPFIMNTEAVARSFGVVQSIASREDADFIHSKIKLFPKRIENPAEPRFVHIDLSYRKDSAGISIGHVSGFKHVQRSEHTETLPIIRYDLILEVKVPPGGEIELENIRKLLYTLRDTLKMPIKWVSFDGFQSRDSMQILFQRGFTVHYASVDKTTDAYDILKQAIYDGRVLAPEHPKARRELISLEIDTKRAVIDHPPRGSKDLADSMAGVAYGLTILREIWIRHRIPMNAVPLSIAQRVPEVATKIVKGGADISYEELTASVH
jgi:hypothetical protein